MSYRRPARRESRQEREERLHRENGPPDDWRDIEDMEARHDDPIGSCQGCGHNLYPFDDPELCDDCFFIDDLDEYDVTGAGDQP